MTESTMQYRELLRYRVEIEVDQDDKRRELRARQKNASKTARNERQNIRRMRRYVQTEARKMVVELNEKLEVVGINGVPDNVFSRRHGKVIVERLLRDYHRGIAAQVATKPRPEKTKVVRAELPAPPKAFAGVWPPRPVKEEKKESAPALIVPSDLLMQGGTMDGTPIGMAPTMSDDFRGGANSTLASADDAECRKIAEEAEAKETVDEESDEGERTVVGERSEGTDSALWEEIEALEHSVKHWQAECEAARTALFEANERTKRAEEAFLSKSNGTQFDDAPHVLARLLLNPNARITLTEALKTASSLYPEKMVVLPTAYESAEKLDSVSTRGGRLLKLLLKLGSEYYETLDGKGDSEARHVFSPSEYSACESETVRSGGLGRLRDFSYNGTSVRMEQHLKIGIAADTSKTLRCYFAWLADESRIVIGHCGEHLPVASH